MKKKSRILRLVTLFLGLGILLALVHYAGFERFWEIVRRISPALLVLSVIVYSAAWAVRIWRLKLFTNHAGEVVGLFDLFKLNISAQALNAVMPTKVGDAALVGYLNMRGIGIGRAAAIVVQTRILDILALILLSIPVFVLSSEEAVPGWITKAVVFCALAVIIPTCFVVLDRQKFFFNVLEKLAQRFDRKMFKWALEKAQEAYRGYHEIMSDRRLLLASIGLSLLTWLCEGLTCYAVSLAVDANVSVVAAVFAVMIGNIGKIAPATPGSVGVYEGIVSTILVWFGVPFDVAVTIAILDHAVKKVFTLSVGAGATAAIGVRLTQIQEMAERKKSET